MFHPVLRSVIPLLVVAVATWAAGRPPHPPWADFDVRRSREARVVGIAPDLGLAIEDGPVVRLIGVNLHPSDEGGIRVSEWLTERLVERRVTLRFDRERIDRRDRVLAFVDFDGTSINEQLVAAGLVVVDRHAPFASNVKRRMERSEDDAREAGRGAWGGTRNDH